ncbi:MAG: ABC transporter transmembrane domain-containing protein, partial [Pseudomonadota bacterium]
MFTAKDRENLVWFWHTYMKAKSPWLLVVMLMIFAQGLVYQQFLALTENGLRVVFERGDMADLMRTCATVFGVFAFRGLMSYFVPRLSAWISEDAVCRLRSDLVSHLTALDLAFFEKTRVGTIILRLANQADRLADFVGQTTVKAIRDAITIIILSVYLGWKQPFLFLMAAAFLPIIILIMQHVSQKVKTIQAEAEGAMAIYING